MTVRRSRHARCELRAGQRRPGGKTARHGHEAHATCIAALRKHASVCHGRARVRGRVRRDFFAECACANHAFNLTAESSCIMCRAGSGGGVFVGVGGARTLCDVRPAPRLALHRCQTRSCQWRPRRGRGAPMQLDGARQHTGVSHVRAQNATLKTRSLAWWFESAPPTRTRHKRTCLAVAALPLACAGQQDDDRGAHAPCPPVERA